jgi:hypothetical protein
VGVPGRGGARETGVSVFGAVGIYPATVLVRARYPGGLPR